MRLTLTKIIVLTILLLLLLTDFSRLSAVIIKKIKRHRKRGT